MKKLNIVFVLIVISNIAFSQEIKTYKGIFKEGTAEYQYYDNGIESQMEGKFLYFEKLDTIKCNYLHNKLSGYYSRKTYDKVDVRKPNDYNAIMVNKLLFSSEGEIKNNNKNGIWKYSKCIKCDYNSYDNKDERYKLEQVTINFKNDTIVGEIDNKIEIIDNNYNKNIFFVKGEFDLKGRFTGRIYKAKQGIFDTLNYINKYEVYKSVLYNHIEYDKINSKYLKIYKMDLENIKKITQSNTFSLMSDKN